MIHREHEFEAVRGLPEHLPSGEEILWQGAPNWRSLAHRVFHVRMIGFYCAAIVLWRVIAVYSGGAALTDALMSGVWLGLVLFGGLSLFVLLAWLQARTTVYTITNRRVVMRYGVAFEIALNIPFNIIHSANLKLHGHGVGDIALSLKGPDRMAYLSLWPHARPGRFNPAEPTLRSIPDAERVGKLLAAAAMPGTTLSAQAAESGTPSEGVAQPLESVTTTA